MLVLGIVPSSVGFRKMGWVGYIDVFALSSGRSLKACLGQLSDECLLSLGLCN